MSDPFRSILITGGAGFIGSAAVRRWLQEDAARGRYVVNLDKLTYAGHPATLRDVERHARYRFVQGDIADIGLVERLLQEHRPAAIVHLAAETHVDRSIDGPPEFVQTNVVGTCQMLEAARSYWEELPGGQRDAFRFLHVSTDEVYGTLPPDEFFRESSRYEPNSPYAASKAAADHFVRAYHRTFGLPAIITNCSNNYGPYQFPEKLIPLMIRKAVAGEALPVYGDGQQVRDWLHVEDHVRGLQCVLENGRPGEVYLIGGDNPLPNLEVVRSICRAVDESMPNRAHRPCESFITYVADRPGHDRRYAIDFSKLRNEIGWRPQIPFAQGLRRTVEWYLTNGSWIDEVTHDQDAGRRRGMGQRVSGSS